MTALQTRPRVLSASDAAALRSLIRHDAIGNCVADSRLDLAPDLDHRRLGGFVWGVDDDSGSGTALRAAVFHGGNLIPMGADLTALERIAEQLSRSPRGCSSIVGSAPAVQVVWQVLQRRWGAARAIRQHQPLLTASRPAAVCADDSVRPVRPEELERFLPAATAMFTEELGISPLGHDSGHTYRARVADVIRAGRAFARFDQHGRVEFKAEIGALSRSTAQIQGVWVRPDLRGQGIGTAAMAQVLALSLRQAPVVSLYVNDFNAPARQMYDRLGFAQVNVFSTVLF